MRDVINEGHLGMKWLGVGAVIAVVAGLVAFGIWRHHVTPPQFEVQVRPRAEVMSKSECRSLKTPGFDEPHWCLGAGWGASYVAIVTNTGGRGALVYSCRIEAIGRSGQVILWTDVPGRIVAHNGLFGLRLEPDESHRFKWFIRVEPRRVARYTGSCSYTENAGII